MNSNLDTPSTLNRRQFVQTSAVGAVALGLPSLSWAERTTRPRRRTLVVFHLAGGNDGLNTVAPYADPAYARLRPSLALAQRSLHELGDGLGLHPALSGLAELWRRQRLAIVNGVGYPRPTTSLDESARIWHAGDTRPGHSGRSWLERAVEVLEERRIAGGAPGRPLECVRPGARPLSADGMAPGPAATAPGPDRFYGLFGDKLDMVVSLLKTDHRPAAVELSLPGFDTHAAQLARHDALLAELDDNLTTYQRRLDSLGLADRVVTALYSEFGRTPAENARGGTDHGTAGPVLILGKGVRPGFHGEQPRLDDLDDGQLRFTVDFRRVLAGLTAGALGVELPQVFGDHAALELIDA